MQFLMYNNVLKITTGYTLSSFASCRKQGNPKEANFAPARFTLTSDPEHWQNTLGRSVKGYHVCDPKTMGKVAERCKFSCHLSSRSWTGLHCRVSKLVNLHARRMHCNCDKFYISISISSQALLKIFQVGHTFLLGNKYSKIFKARCLNENQKYV